MLLSQHHNKLWHHSLNRHQLLASIPSGCLPTTSVSIVYHQKVKFANIYANQK